jgi:hypothetical protein
MKKEIIELALEPNSLLLQAIRGAVENHKSYCDSHCFTEGDVLFVLLRDEGYIPLTEWETFKAEFGNKSFDHLISATNYVRRVFEENL